MNYNFIAVSLSIENQLLPSLSIKSLVAIKHLGYSKMRSNRNNVWQDAPEYLVHPKVQSLHHIYYIKVLSKQEPYKNDDFFMCHMASDDLLVWTSG